MSSVKFKLGFSQKNPLKKFAIPNKCLPRSYEIKNPTNLQEYHTGKNVVHKMSCLIILHRFAY